MHARIGGQASSWALFCPRREPSPSLPHQRLRRDEKKRAGVLKGVRSAQEAINIKRSRLGRWSPQGWPEIQAPPALLLPRTQLRQHNPTMSLNKNTDLHGDKSGVSRASNGGNALKNS